MAEKERHCVGRKPNRRIAGARTGARTGARIRFPGPNASTLTVTPSTVICLRSRRALNVQHLHVIWRDDRHLGMKKGPQGMAMRTSVIAGIFSRNRSAAVPDLCPGHGADSNHNTGHNMGRHNMGRHSSGNDSTCHTASRGYNDHRPYYNGNIEPTFLWCGARQRYSRSSLYRPLLAQIAAWPGSPPAWQERRQPKRQLPRPML